MDTPLPRLHEHSQSLMAVACQCQLCGQRIRQAGRIKAHWQLSHPKAWQQSQMHAVTEAGSLSSIFKVPCPFCGSSAKNSKQHARQCPMLFQILALRWLAQSGTGSTTEDSKPPASRKHEAAPKYHTFVSPMQQALKQGARAKGSTTSTQAQLEPPRETEAQPQSLSKDLQRQPTGAANQAGPLHRFFRPQQSGSTDTAAGATPWTCRIRLQNPHAVCYANAATLALHHAVLCPSMQVPEIHFLQKLGNNAAAQNKSLFLPQLNLFRRLTPQWVFDAEQKDAAEYLHGVFQAASSVQVTWDTRRQTDEGIRLAVSGTQPVLIPITAGTPSPTELQHLIVTWHHTEGDTTALTHPAELICLQLGRYHADGKQMQAMHFAQTVQMPVFNDNAGVDWWDYSISSIVLHLGRSTHTGHYRALLRVQQAWLLTEDAQIAKPVTLHNGHLRNAYVFVMRRVQPHAHVESHRC